MESERKDRESGGLEEEAWAVVVGLLSPVGELQDQCAGLRCPGPWSEGQSGSCKHPSQLTPKVLPCSSLHLLYKLQSCGVTRSGLFSGPAGPHLPSQARVCSCVFSLSLSTVDPSQIFT